MGGKVFEMKLDRLSGILRGLFYGASVRNATRKRRDKDRVTPRLFGNQADLIGKQFLLFAHASIMPAQLGIARATIVTQFAGGTGTPACAKADAFHA